MDKKLFLNMILAETEPVEMVKRSIDSVNQYVDGLYIAVTYKDKEPTDKNPLVQFLNKIGANIFYFKWTSDFSEEIQFIMDNTPHGANTFIYWQDADDILLNPDKLRGILDLAIEQNIAAVFLKYLYQVDLDENNNIKEVIIEHKRERVIRNDGTFKWVGMLHEILVEQRVENVVKILNGDCEILHLSNDERITKALDRNIDILEAQLKKENRGDPRTLVYLAKAYFDRANHEANEDQKKISFDLSYSLFDEYLNGWGTPGKPGYKEGSGWPEERASAWGYISEIAKINNKFNIAERALHNAIIEDPEEPKYYVNMAQVHAMKGDHAKAKHWLRLATSIPYRETSMVVSPKELKARALEVDYAVALNEGRFDQAEADAEILADMIPENKQLQERLVSIKNMNSANKAAQSVVYLGKYLEGTGEKEKLKSLVNSIPKDLQQERFVSEMKHQFIPPRIWGDNEIAILCGPGFEFWSPKSLETGLGGSESAVVYLSEELTKIGWAVTVYANPPSEECGDHNGVEYKPYHEINLKDQFNVLVLWRGIGFVDHDVKAKLKMVWMHDVPLNPDFTQKRVGKVDKIIALSEYHKGLFKMAISDGSFAPIPEEKMFVSSNGIRYITPPEVKRDPHKMIFTSSPDRGLIYLLNNWEKIRKEVPDATLDVYYGFQVFDVIHGNNPAKHAWKNKILSLMKQKGINYIGRVGHEELSKAFASAGIWSYSTDFTEISCISAMEAQAYGAVPVCTDLAALKETVRNGIRVDVDIKTKDGEETYINELISLLKDGARQEEMRKTMMPWAKDYFGWEKVAGQWDTLMKSSLPVYKSVGGEENGSKPK